MTVIYISVKFKFTIKKFPVEITEIFMVIKQILIEVGKTLAKELIKRLENIILEELKGKGCKYHDRQERTLKGCLGPIVFNLLRLEQAGEYFYAICRKINIPAYVRYTKDCFETALGLLPHLSYRRSSTEAVRIEDSGPGKNALHRYVKQIAPNLRIHPVKDAKGYEYLVVDATGAKFQEPFRQDGILHVNTYSGEIRAVYAGKTPKGPYKVIGRWTNRQSWEEIAVEVYKRITPEYVKFLISDGGPGIEEAFLKSHMKHQRCSVHAWREFKIFLYQDGIKKKKQEKYHEVFNNIPVFRYANKEVIESLQPEDAPEIKKVISESRKQLLELQNILQSKGYNKASVYIGNLIEPLLTFLREWIKSGESPPATSNIAENRFSLIKNRIARIGRRWSESGLLRWFDLAVHKIFPGYDWNKLMERITPLSGNITCCIDSVT